MFYYETPTYFDYLPIEIHNIIAKFVRILSDNNKIFLNFEYKHILSDSTILMEKSRYQHKKLKITFSMLYDRVFRYNNSRICYFDKNYIQKGISLNYDVRSTYEVSYLTIWDFIRINNYYKYNKNFYKKYISDDINSYYEYINYHFDIEYNIEYRWIDNFIKQKPDYYNRRLRDLDRVYESSGLTRKKLVKLYTNFFGKLPPKNRSSKNLVNDMIQYS